METQSKTMNECYFANVRLPLLFKPESKSQDGMNEDGFDGGRKVFSVEEATKIAVWLKGTAVKEHDTYLQIAFVKPAMWVRLSGQIYLEESDFKWVGPRLKELCERVEKGEVV